MSSHGLAILTLAAAVLLFQPAPAPAAAHEAQTPAAPQQKADPGQQQTPAPMTEQQMMERCKKAMAEHQEMMSRMKAAEAELDKLVARMNAAQGNEKVDATAAVVTEMVKQRQASRMQMMQMHDRMMGHMMEHMQMGDPQAMRRSMQACPMMKGAMAPGHDKH